MDRAPTRDELIKKYQSHAKDTGSAPVQIILLTWAINKLTEHLKVHKKDVHSKQGLIVMVGKRRKLLDYLKVKSSEKYKELITELGIRK